MKSITAKELKARVDAGDAIILIDVRENNEYEMANMGGILIPMSEIKERFNEIPKEGDVVVHCRSGMRSANVIQFLNQYQGYDNLYNLDGGIMAWAADVDPTLHVQ